MFLSRYDFKANVAYRSVKNGNVLKVTANASFDRHENRIRNQTVLISIKDSCSVWTVLKDIRKSPLQESLEEPMPSAFFKIKIGASALKIAKKDNKGNNVADVQFQDFLSCRHESESRNIYNRKRWNSNDRQTATNNHVYIQEVKVPDHLVLDSTVPFSRVESWSNSFVYANE